MLLQKNFEHIMLLTYAITIGILLIKIGNRRTIITRISPFIITIGLSVFLVRIGHQWTIVWSIGYAIIVRVVIASIANTVPIGVLLSGIWCFGTIVLTTFLLKINVYSRTTRILDGRNSQKYLHQTWADLLTLIMSHKLTQYL